MHATILIYEITDLIDKKGKLGVFGHGNSTFRKIIIFE